MPSVLYYIESYEIDSADFVRSLISNLRQEHSTSIYLFWPKDSAINQFISAAIKEKQLQQLIPEDLWYKRPRKNRASLRWDDFVHIPRNASAGSHKEIQEAQPMLYRAELRLATGREGKRKIVLPGDFKPKPSKHRPHPEPFDSLREVTTFHAARPPINTKGGRKSNRGPAPGTNSLLKRDQP